MQSALEGSVMTLLVAYPRFLGHAIGHANNIPRTPARSKRRILEHLERVRFLRAFRSYSQWFNRGVWIDLKKT